MNIAYHIGPRYAAFDATRCATDADTLVDEHEPAPAMDFDTPVDIDAMVCSILNTVASSRIPHSPQSSSALVPPASTDSTTTSSTISAALSVSWPRSTKSPSIITTIDGLAIAEPARMSPVDELAMACAEAG